MASFLKEFNSLHASAMGRVVSNSFCGAFKSPDLSGKYSPARLHTIIKDNLKDTLVIIRRLNQMTSDMDSFEDMEILDPVIQEVLEVKNDMQQCEKELTGSMEEIESDMKMKFRDIEVTGKNVGKFYEISERYYDMLREYCRLD